MKKFKSIVLVLLLLFVNVLLFCGCDADKTLFVSNSDYNFAIVLHNNFRVLHKIGSIHVNNTGTITIKTTCCFNTIFFSSINGELYANLPKEFWYDVACDNC